MNDLHHPCELWAEPLSLAAAGCLSPDEERDVRRHIETCSACRERFEQLTRLCGVLAEARLPADSVERAVVERLMAAVASDQSASPVVRSRVEILHPALLTRFLDTWRWIMRSPVSRVSVGAVLVLAIATVALWFHASGTPYAFADFVKPILEAKSAKFKVVFERHGKQVATGNCMVLAPNRDRMELQEPGRPVEIMISDHSQGVVVMIDSVRKVAVVNKVAGLPGEQASMNLLEEMRALILGAEKPDVRRESLGEKEVEGRRAVGWRLSGPGLQEPGLTATIWGDPQTGLPIRLESYYALHDQKSTCSDFVFNVDLDASLFSLEPPAGYTVQTVQVDASQPTEKDLIALLREYSTLMNNAFPETLDMDRLRRTLQARVSVEIAISGDERPSDEFLRKITEAGTDEAIGKILEAERRKNEEKSQAELLRLMRNTKPDKAQEKVDVAKIAKDARQRAMDARQKAMEAFTAKITDIEMMMTRGLGFAIELPREADAHYAGKGVSRGTSGTPIFWYRPKDAKKYRVIHADLSVREADTPPDVSQAQPVPAASSRKE
jgi:outer membrane lipoprotein-sorting protein